MQRQRLGRDSREMNRRPPVEARHLPTTRRCTPAAMRRPSAAGGGGGGSGGLASHDHDLDARAMGWGKGKCSWSHDSRNSPAWKTKGSGQRFQVWCAFQTVWQITRGVIVMWFCAPGETQHTGTPRDFWFPKSP